MNIALKYPENRKIREKLAYIISKLLMRYLAKTT